MTKELESARKLCGMLRMSKGLSDDGVGKIFRNLLPMRTVCPLLLEVIYCLHQCVRLPFYLWWVMCFLEVSLSYVSYLILGFIHSEISTIALIPIVCNLYCLQVFLDPSETTITVMVAPITMAMMLM